MNELAKIRKEYMEGMYKYLPDNEWLEGNETVALLQKYVEENRDKMLRTFGYVICIGLGEFNDDEDLPLLIDSGYNWDEEKGKLTTWENKRNTLMTFDKSYNTLIPSSPFGSGLFYTMSKKEIEELIKQSDDHTAAIIKASIMTVDEFTESYVEE